MPRPARKRVTTLPYCRWRWTAEQRFDHFTKRDPVSGCRIWQGSLANGGYGQLTFRGRSYLAHRLAWIVKNGPIPPGLHVCHRCDERRCVNTEHLFLGSHSVNMNDLRMKTRRWYGATNPTRRPSQKSAADVAPIRVLYRGIEFVGHAVARPIDPDMPLPTRFQRPPSKASRKAPRTAAAPAHAPTSRTRSSSARRRCRTAQRTPSRRSRRDRR
jgi:hypothetical protein